MKYFVILLILIGFAGISFAFEPSYTNYYSNPEFRIYSLVEGQYVFDIPYHVSHGTVEKIEINCDTSEIVLSIASTDESNILILALPRVLIDSKFDTGNDDVFFVLENSEETQFTELTDAGLRILTIPISENASTITVIGSNYPESPQQNTCKGSDNPPFSYPLLSQIKQFKTFVIDGYTITVDNPHVTSLELDWGSEKMPSGSLVFDKVISDKVTLQIPKEMPRTINLDFDFGYYAIQSNGKFSLPSKLLESDSFYFLELPVRNSDKITIGSSSPAAGRIAVLEDPLTSVLDNCECQISGEECMQPRLKFKNSTHYIDNDDCKWRLLPTESDCGPGTKFQDGGCIRVPIERELFMHGGLGPILLSLLAVILVSPIYAIWKFNKRINKILFILSIVIAAIIFASVIYGEFFLVGNEGIAPSANESHFFALSIVGSFFVIASFAILGIVYWKKNENPKKLMIFTFFIISAVPIIALMTGLLPRGAEA